MIELPQIELDDLDHVYRLNGIEVPGCTSVLAAMGATPSFNFLSVNDRAFYQSRGHSGHKAVELVVKGELDRRTVAKDMRGYLRSWEIGCEEYGVEPICDDQGPFVERVLAHPIFRYGVKPDLAAKVLRVPSVVEIKLTSNHTPATAIQTASQMLAAKLQIPDLRDRYAFRLDANGGKPDVKKYTDPTDEGVWLSLLNSYNWLTKHKLLKKEKNGSNRTT